MSFAAYSLFSTAIGTCGIAWGDAGIVAVQLPERSDRGTTMRLLRAHRDARKQAPPPAVRRCIDDIVALLDGEPRDLRLALLDMEGLPAFHQRVFAIVREIPPGQTRSYGEVAALCGEPGAARAVGQAMARNPFPLIVPCHRVLAAHGGDGGFSAFGGVETKRRLLEIEAVATGAPPRAGNLALPF